MVLTFQRGRATVLALALFFFVSTSALAHDIPIERSALVQVSAESVELMVVYSEAPGKRTELLMARFDLDSDGRIGEKETVLAAPEMTRRAFAGLSFWIDGRRLKTDYPEVKFSRNRAGALVAAFYIEHDFERDDAAHLLAIDVEDANGVIPLQTVAEAGTGMEFFKAIPGEVHGDEISPLHLAPGAEFRAVFLKAATEKHEGNSHRPSVATDAGEEVGLDQ